MTDAFDPTHGRPHLEALQRRLDWISKGADTRLYRATHWNGSVPAVLPRL